MHQHQQHHLHLHQQAASAATALESVDNIWFQSSDLTETNFCKQYVSLPLSFDLSGLCVKRILSSQKRSLEPNFHDLEYSVVLWLEQNVELLYIYVVYGVLCIGIIYMYCGQSRAWSLLRGQKTGAASSFFFFRQNFLPSPSTTDRIVGPKKKLIALVPQTGASQLCNTDHRERITDWGRRRFFAQLLPNHFLFLFLTLKFGT